MSVGNLLDADVISYDPKAIPGLKLIDVAPGISFAGGWTTNSMIVEMKDYLVFFDAPYGEKRAKWTIEEAKKKYPGKPVKYLILSHHHMDHTNGVRVYAAEGATVVVGQTNGAFFRKVLTSPDSLGIDSPKKKIVPKIEEVADRWSITDGTRKVEAYLISSPHSSGTLIGYIPDAKLGYVCDIWSPARDKWDPENDPYKLQMSFMLGVRKWAASGLRPERFAGCHGTVAPYPEAAK
jgi:flavorubredoxin